MKNSKLIKTIAVILSVLTVLGACAFASVSAGASEYVKETASATYYYGGDSVTYHKPKITINSSDAAKINSEINNFYDTKVYYANNDYRYSEMRRDIVYYTYLNYTSAVKNNVLSVVMDYKHFNNNIHDYYVGNLNIKTGKRMSRNDVISAMGTNYNTVKSAVKEYIASKFDALSSSIKKQTAYKNGRSRTFADSNIDRMRVFVDNKGKLNAICTVYWVAGAGSYDWICPAYDASYPAVKANAANGGVVNISWSRLSGIGKYRVYKKVNGSWQRIGDSTGSSFTDKSVKAGSTYTYTVRGIDSKGSRFTSAYDTKGVTIKYAATPKISTIDQTADGFKLSWSKVANAEKYRIYRYVNGWKRVGDSTGTSYNFNAKNLGTSFRFTIRTISANGERFTSGYNNNGWSAKHFDAPKITKASNTKKGVSLNWNKQSGVEKFRVYRKTSGASWTRIADTTAATYTDGSAKNGTRYYYTVRCISSDAKSFQSYYNTSGTSIVCKR